MSKGALLGRFFENKTDYLSTKSYDEQNGDVENPTTNDDDVVFDGDKSTNKCKCNPKLTVKSAFKKYYRKDNKWSFSRIYSAYVILATMTSIMTHLCMMMTGYELFYFVDFGINSHVLLHKANVINSVNAMSEFEPVMESVLNETNDMNNTSFAPLSLESIQPYACNSDSDCGNNGVCDSIKDIYSKVVGSKCSCRNSYITVGSNFCGYHQLSMWIALLLSICLGEFGIDRCFLSRGNFSGICIGILKGSTAGCFGILWILDPILICSKILDDGNGQPLDFKLSSLF